MDNWVKFTLILIVLVSLLWYCNKSEAYDRVIMEDKMDEKIVDRIIRSCENRYEELEVKEWRNVERCIKVSFAIACNESSCGKRYINNSIHWVQKKFDTQLDAINYWTTTYYKWWYKATEWSFFYGSENWPAPSLYCTSEVSSGSVYHCPNWRKIFNYYFKLVWKN